MNNAPIGIFDSGLGGLTVARSIIDRLPGEEIIYIGDTAHTPYGDKPEAQVRERSAVIMEKLVSYGVKMLVIACNTASAAIYEDARETYLERNIPVLEVIRPAVRTALATTRNQVIGVIATDTTIKSGAYQAALAHRDVTVVARACPDFVKFVEAGITTGFELNQVAESYLAPVRWAGVDTLVLGCTHYPLLTGVISYVMGPEVVLVSSAEQTANDVYRQLVDSSLLRGADRSAPQHRFLATGDTTQFKTLARRFLGPEVQHVAQV